MMDLFASPWIPTIGMVMLALAVRSLSTSWFAPGPFALLVWSAYLVLPLVVAPEYEVPAIGVWLILGLVASIAIGAELGIGSAVPDKDDARQGLPTERLLHLALVLSSFGFLGALYWTATALSDNGLDFSLPGLLGLGHLLSVERYGGEQPPLLARALVIWIFPSALLSGMAFALAKKYRDRLLSLCFLVPAIFLSLIQATKANTLIAIALGIAGYLAAKVFAGGRAHRPTSRKALLFVAGGVGLAVSFFLTMDALRRHDKQEEDVQVDADWGRVKVSSVGYLAVFGSWATRQELVDSLPSLGAYTFAGLLESTGLHSRKLGLYTESIAFKDDESNIYTAFRGLIEDFSLLGAIVFCFLIGLFSSAAYRRLLRGEKKWLPFVAAYYAFLLWSPIASIFVYNGSVL